MIDESDNDVVIPDIVASGPRYSDNMTTVCDTGPDLSVSCRYVRVTTIDWNTSWVAVNEFQIYGY